MVMNLCYIFGMKKLKMLDKLGEIVILNKDIIDIEETRKNIELLEDLIKENKDNI